MDSAYDTNKIIVLTIVETKAYKKCRKICQDRGWDMSELDNVVDILSKQECLRKACRPHKWQGSFKKNVDVWELHVANDWLLLYKICDDCLKLFAIGTHSGLTNSN